MCNPPPANTLTPIVIEKNTLTAIAIEKTLEAIASRKWDTFRLAILSRPAMFCHMASAVSSCSELNGMTLLHAALRFDPPLDVIVMMIHICPDMLTARDCLGRTPLHVAAGSKASSAALIKVLATACPTVCDAQDVDGKTPLHFLCDSHSVMFEDDEDESYTPRQPPNHEAVAALVSFSIRSATLEDDEEMNPLEYAIMSDATLKTVQLLQSATRRGMILMRRNACS
jgi:hypothetical protein